MNTAKKFILDFAPGKVSEQPPAREAKRENFKKYKENTVRLSFLRASNWESVANIEHATPTSYLQSSCSTMNSTWITMCSNAILSYFLPHAS